MKFLLSVVLALAASVNGFTPRAQFANRVVRAAPLAMSAVAAPSTKLPASVKPGVVTGQALVDLLDYAKENEFAIPGVNIVGA